MIQRIENLVDGSVITQPIRLLVVSIYQGITKKDAPYCNIQLRDITGVCDMMMWDVTKNDIPFKEGDILEITGQVKFYDNKLQIVTRTLEIVQDSPVNYLPQIDEVTREKLLNELHRFIQIVEIQHPAYASLLYELFTNEGFLETFCNAPAAVRYHSAHIGGLLEHTIKVTQVAERLLPNNPLLITAALLHDVGKIDAYSYYPVIGLSTEGELLGHIAPGLQFLPKVIRKLRNKDVQFSKNDELYLYHCIASHHGALEHGSPVIPMFEEAFALALADKYASTIETYYNEVQKITPGKSEWSTLMKQFIYRKA